MENGQLGVLGGVMGGLLGVLGAAMGVYLSIKNTKGPRERAFVVKAAVWFCLGIASFLALLFLLPSWLPPPHKSWASLLWVVYVPALLVSIILCNRGQARVRSEEAQDDSSQEDTSGGEDATAS